MARMGSADLSGSCAARPAAVPAGQRGEGVRSGRKRSANWPGVERSVSACTTAANTNRSSRLTTFSRNAGSRETSVSKPATSRQSSIDGLTEEGCWSRSRSDFADVLSAPARDRAKGAEVLGFSGWSAVENLSDLGRSAEQAPSSLRAGGAEAISDLGRPIQGRGDRVGQRAGGQPAYVQPRRAEFFAQIRKRKIGDGRQVVGLRPPLGPFCSDAQIRP